MRNSLIISLSTTVICLIAGTFAAYPFARLYIPGESNFLLGILAAQMLPVIVIIIPLSLVMQRLGLIDTYGGLILLYTGFLLPTVIWIMYGYLQTIPRELEDAAMIDGCTRFGAIIRVILPLAGPGLVAVGTFAFLSSWNEFFMALIFTASQRRRSPSPSLNSAPNSALTLASWPRAVCWAASRPCSWLCCCSAIWCRA